MSGAILAALPAALLPACRAFLARTPTGTASSALLAGTRFQLLRGISHLQAAIPSIQTPSQHAEQSATTIQDPSHTVTGRIHPPTAHTQPFLQFHRTVAAMAGMRPAAQSEREQQEAEPLPGLRRTVWGQLDLKPRFPKLESHVHADVAVIGGGIAGLSIAYELQRKGKSTVLLERLLSRLKSQLGKSTVLLERRCIGSGQTGRTTAHIMAWNDDFYMNLEKSFGRDNTGLVAESHRQAIACIEDTVAREAIDCKFTRLHGYLFPHDSKPSTLEMLHLEYEACRRAGFTDVYMADLKGDPALGSVHKAICFPSTVEFHPLMYLNGLADAFVRHGGRIFEQTVAFREEGSVTGAGAGAVVANKDGRGVVHAGAVVLATKSPINHNLLVHARQPADRSYVVGLHLPKGSVKRANWWDTASPYHYVRVEEQEGCDVLVVGGGDHPVGMPASQYHDVWGELERWARPRWPMAQETLFRWSGMVYEPMDFLGLYGRNPMDATHTYIATGDSGQGMTGGTIAAMIISDLICRRPNPFVEIYSPSRLPTISKESLSLAGSVVSHTFQGYLDACPWWARTAWRWRTWGADAGRWCAWAWARPLSSVIRTAACTPSQCSRRLKSHVAFSLLFPSRPLVPSPSQQHVRTWGAACTGTPTTPPLTVRAMAPSSTTEAAASTALPGLTSHPWTPATRGSACMGGREEMGEGGAAQGEKQMWR
ncbi:unnamed protein product [Closterium sp. NIES-53]